MEAYFSIYKLDVDHIWSKMLGKEDKAVDFDEICNHVIKNVKKNSLDGYVDLQSSKVLTNDNDYLLIYRKDRPPQWLNAIMSAFKDSNFSSDHYRNSSTSYLMLTISNNSIYATTGGHASTYINKFIVKGFGLSFLPKLFHENENVIKELTERNLVGRRHSSNLINRINTEFSSEKDYGKLFKKINSMAELTILDKLGLLNENDEEINNRSVSIISTDALNIRKRIDLSKYRELLKRIDEMDQNEPKFALSYFVPLSNYSIKKSEVNKIFIDQIVENNKLKFEVQIVGDDYSMYLGGSKFIVYDENNREVHTTDKYLKFDELFDLFFEETKKNINKTNVELLLNKWQISVESSDGEYILIKQKIFDVIDFNFEYTFEIQNRLDSEDKYKEDLTVYLSGGAWYVLDTNYQQFIEDSYLDIYQNDRTLVETLYSDYGLKTDLNTEKEYNDSFEPNRSNNSKVIHSDKVCIKNIELSDLIVLHNERAYLICNKRTYSGSGARDLLNQIDAASYLLFNDNKTIISYYNKLIEQGKINENDIDKEYFTSCMKNIVFVSAYIEKELEPDSKALYGKLLSVHTSKLLKERNHGFLIGRPKIRE